MVVVKGGKHIGTLLRCVALFQVKRATVLHRTPRDDGITLHLEDCFSIAPTTTTDLFCLVFLSHSQRNGARESFVT